MNIQAISKFNFYPNNKSNSKGNVKLADLPYDSFQYKNKSKPSFGAVIKRKEIFRSCDAFVFKEEDISNLFKIFDSVMDFYGNNQQNWFGSSSSEASQKIAATCRHEMDNLVLANTGKCILIEKEINAKHIFRPIKICANKWTILEKWHDNPQKIIPVNHVITMLGKTIKNIDQENIILTGDELLKNKNVKNPFQLYNLLSQPLMNAIKYGEQKPFKIAVEEGLKDGKKVYYASIINPETKPIPNEEIDKILEGNHYRASNVENSKISGTGFGFTEMIRILKENGYEQDIPNLIAKDRELGVCVRVPLVGIE